MRRSVAGLFAACGPEEPHGRPPSQAACFACLYVPGQIIVGTGVHAEPPSLRLRVDQEVVAAACLANQIARGPILWHQQTGCGSAVGYGSGIRGLESRGLRGWLGVCSEDKK